MLQTDILDLFSSFHNCTLDLDHINLAHIVLIPKTDETFKVTDFGPICLIHRLFKILMKVANRLKTVNHLEEVNRCSANLMTNDAELKIKLQTHNM